MKIDKIKKVLSKYYKEITVKKILAGDVIPSYKKMIVMLDEDKIPLIAWRNIREYCGKPKRKYTKKEDKKNPQSPQKSEF